jgi:hypothetical protein
MRLDASGILAKEEIAKVVRSGLVIFAGTIAKAEA